MAEDKKKTLLEKLALARVDLQASNLKKTGKSLGKDKTVRFVYLELGDFLPLCNELAVKHRFLPVVSYTAEVATMTIHDFDSEDTIVIMSPMANANVYQADEVQNLGAVQSYLRRYLYMTAFDIAVPDEVDGKSGYKQETEPKRTASKTTPPPRKTPAEDQPATQDMLSELQNFMIEKIGDKDDAKLAGDYALTQLEKMGYKDLLVRDIPKMKVYVIEYGKMLAGGGDIR